MHDKRKVQKKLGKRCPECDGVLELVSKITKDDGVEYSEQYEECDCGYSERLKVSTKRCKDNYNPKY
jgi:uncharacterized protein with PIN domain